MEILTLLFETLKYILPAIVVGVVVKMLNDNQLEKDKVARAMTLRADVLKANLPLKLSAYERAVLFLERIHPRQLLSRISGAGKSSHELYAELVMDIRTEYEHNLVQQIYISNAAWAQLVRAKEEMLSIITVAHSELEEGENGIALSKKIIEKCSALKEFSSQNAINSLKADIQSLFRV